MSKHQTKDQRTSSNSSHDGPSGFGMLTNPLLYKGTAFTEAEREKLGLRGLLPPRIFSEQEQAQRAYGYYKRKSTPMGKYLSLTDLQDRNETLFYRVLIDHMEEMMPIVYTPTVGQACQEYGHIFRRPRGIFISSKDKGSISDVLANWPVPEVDIIVVTDGERILGLGDLGAHGMGIPVGKLTLYTACAGVDPNRCLPITLDVGTNNEKLLKDPLYIGLPQHRLWGDDYDEFMEEFVQAVQERFPGVLLQFEDFSNTNAFRLLARYKDQICTFNDDIQGTAGVALAGILASLRITGMKLSDHKLLFFGAGEANIGIAELVVSGLMQEGMTEKEARKRCWFFDSRGLVVAGRKAVNENKAPFAHKHREMASLEEAILDLKPTGLIGASGVPQTFSQPMVEALCEFNEKPLVFALSNPTSKAECTAEQAYTWSKGKALFASGSPFDPVEYEGRIHVPGQGNNAYVFPGVGLGVIAAGARLVTDEMFYISAQSLAHQVTRDELASGSLYPKLDRIRAVSARIATDVADLAHERGLATKPRPRDQFKAIQAMMYEPNYQSYL